MDRNRRFAELAGYVPTRGSCGYRGQHENNGDCWDEDLPCSKCHWFVRDKYPDFIADPTLVLEVMQDKELLEEFMFWYSKGQSVGWVRTDHILDRTGKLAEMAIEWMEGRGK